MDIFRTPDLCLNRNVIKCTNVLHVGTVAKVRRLVRWPYWLKGLTNLFLYVLFWKGSVITKSNPVLIEFSNRINIDINSDRNQNSFRFWIILPSGWKYVEWINFVTKMTTFCKYVWTGNFYGKCLKSLFFIVEPMQFSIVVILDTSVRFKEKK